MSDAHDVDISPGSILRMVQAKRVQLLQGTAEGGIDKDELLLMRDMAKTSVDELRVNVESEGLKAEQEMAAVMTRLVSRMGENPFAARGPVEGREPITLDADDLPAVELVEGETSTDPSDLDYKSFVKGERDE